MAPSSRLLACLLAVLIAGPSLAAAPRATVSWNHCGVAGDTLATFACNGNTGSHRLVVSFVAPAVPQPIRSIAATLEIWTEWPEPLPAWWEFGGCRPLSPVSDVAAVTPADVGCPNPWPATVYTSVQPQPLPPVLRIRVLVLGDPVWGPPIEGTEYLAFALDIMHRHTTGTGSCAGCAVSAGIILRTLELRDDGGNTMAYLDTRSWVSWQCPGHAIPDVSFGYDGWGVESGCATAARPSTWGRLKAIYR